VVYAYMVGCSICQVETRMDSGELVLVILPECRIGTGVLIGVQRHREHCARDGQATDD
jgi:hypothetical protein